MNHPSEETETLSRPDGPELFCRRWTPAEPRARLSIVHGFSEHSGRYREVALYFAQKGYEVSTFDLRGHGQSGGQRGHVNAWSEYLADVEFFRTHWLRAEPGPSHWLGHSMGGLITIGAAVAGTPMDALVATSPLLGLVVQVPAYKRILAHLTSALLPKLSLPTEHSGQDLTHDQDLAQVFDTDPLIAHSASSRWFTEMTRAVAEMEDRGPQVSIPLFVLHAELDRITDPQASQRFMETVASEEKKFQLWPGGFHEILNEVDRQSVYETIWEWLEFQISPMPY